MRKILSVMTVALALVACSSEDTVQGGDDVQQGKTYPLTFSIAMESETRATTGIKQTFTDNDVIGVRIDGGEGVKYLVKNGSSLAPADADKSLTLTEGDDAKITAWYPFEKKNVDISNQSDADYDYTNYNFIKAEKTINGYDGSTTISLKFMHQMVKIKYELTKGEGITAEELANAEVSFFGNTLVSFENGDVSSSEPNWVKANAGDKAALMAPQTVSAANDFICVAVGGTEFKTKLSKEKELVAGKVYKYKIKVNKTGIVLSNCTISSWDGATSEVDDGKTKENLDDCKVINGVYHVFNKNGFDQWAEQARNTPGTSCVLHSDIELDASNANNWTAIGTDYKSPFSGTFDGNGHTISNLTINKSSEKFQGFIGWNSGTVKNLTLSDAKVEGNMYVGAVAGRNNGTIDNCHVVGNSTVKGSSYIGGIAGRLDSSNASVSNCSVSENCTVEGQRSDYDYLRGGIVGYAFYGKVTACYALCKVQGGGDYVGGVIGQNYGATVQSCYYFGEIIPNSGASGFGENVGAVAGEGECSDCYWAETENSKVKKDNYATKVDGTTVTWEMAKDAMNDKLPAGNAFKYALNPDGATTGRPLILVPAE